MTDRCSQHLTRLARTATQITPTSPRHPRLVNLLAGDAEIVSGGDGGVEPAADQAILTVATFNIQFGLQADRAAAELSQAARFRRPDLVLLQEMDPDGTARIARDLGFHYVYAPAVVHPRHGRPFGQAILSPWPLRNARIVHLPHSHPLNGQRRIALLATAEIAGRDVRAGSIHTETALLPASYRREQVAAALLAFAGWDGPAVVGGDFNTVTRANVRDVTRVGRLCGFQRIVGHGPTVDWRPGGVRLASFTLDHVLTRGLAIHTTAATHDTAASDHRPVWATFHLPPAPPLAKAV